MTITHTTPNFPIAIPKIELDTSAHGFISIVATWPEIGCGDPRVLDALVPVSRDESSVVAPDPDLRASVSVVRDDTIIGTKEPTSLTSPMLGGLLHELRNALDHLEYDVHAFIAAVASASPRTRFRENDCPVLPDLAMSNTPVNFGR